MKLKKARTAGFCFGVRRAINLAEETLEKKNKIYTLGPLIHNPQEIGRLAEKGIRPLEKVGRLRRATIIIRTHGIPARLRKNLESRKLDLVDATCPFVERALDIVKRLCRDKYQVIIIGDRTHPEIIALVSYAGRQCYVVEKKEDVKKIKFSKNIGIVSQTTQTPENFDEIITAIQKVRPDAKIFNTICRATIDRQAEAKKLAQDVDVMVVVGGKNSGNTRRLFEICRRYTASHAIEKAEEIKPQWFRGAKSCGVTAGASTPDWIIDAVKEKIVSCSKSIGMVQRAKAGTATEEK